MVSVVQREWAAKNLQGPDHRRRCLELADDRLPVPAIVVLPGDRWRRTFPFRRPCPRDYLYLVDDNDENPRAKLRLQIVRRSNNPSETNPLHVPRTASRA